MRHRFRSAGHNSGHYRTAIDLVVAAFVSLKEGELIEFDRIAMIADKTGATLRGVVNRARLKATKEHRVVVQNVPGVGYRRLDPLGITEHVVVRDRKKARRHTWRALARARSVDRARVPKQELSRLDGSIAALGAMSAMLTPARFTEQTPRPKRQAVVEAGDLSHLSSIR